MNRPTTGPDTQSPPSIARQDDRRRHGPEPRRRAHRGRPRRRRSARRAPGRTPAVHSEHDRRRDDRGPARGAWRRAAAASEGPGSGAARARHGFLVALGLGVFGWLGRRGGRLCGRAVGVGVAVGASAASRTALWSPVLEIHHAVAGASLSAPGSTTMSWRSAQPSSPPASRYCATNLPVALVERDDPVVGRVERVEEAVALARLPVRPVRRREQDEVRVRAAPGVSLGAWAVQPDAGITRATPPFSAT